MFPLSDAQLAKVREAETEAEPLARAPSAPAAAAPPPGIPRAAALALCCEHLQSAARGVCALCALCSAAGRRLLSRDAAGAEAHELEAMLGGESPGSPAPAPAPTPAWLARPALAPTSPFEAEQARLLVDAAQRARVALSMTQHHTHRHEHRHLHRHVHDTAFRPVPR